MLRMASVLRGLLRSGQFLELPGVYDPITARIARNIGFETVYNGGFVTGGKTCISEPLLTMTDQLGIAEEIARAVDVPLVMDAGAGWGEPLHTMRTVRECILAGIAGIHIEDQVFPKRAHYHTYIVQDIPRGEFADKIRFACKERDEVDPDFVIIARSDAARVEGLGEAIDRVNAAADVGADMGLVFPRDHAEAVRTPELSDLPMIYVQSRGTRDGRPLYNYQELKDMGYAGCIDATLSICLVYHHMQEAMSELKRAGDYTLLTEQQFVAARKHVEDTIGLDDYYRIEQETVEGLKPAQNSGLATGAADHQ